MCVPLSRLVPAETVRCPLQILIAVARMHGTKPQETGTNAPEERRATAGALVLPRRALLRDLRAICKRLRLELPALSTTPRATRHDRAGIQLPSHQTG